MSQLDNIDPKVLGQRLSESRKARGLTQQEAADHLGVSRPTLIAIEKGARAPKAEEIVQLARYYGRRVHEFVRPGAPMADLQPQLRTAARKMSVETADLVQGIADLQQFADDYCELERLMRAPMTHSYPPELRIGGRVDVAAIAEDAAIQERRRLGLGDQPVLRLRSILENDVGARVCYGSLPSAVAGMFAYGSDVGCCIMVNWKHPAERRRASLAHEYGHLFVDRYKPGIDRVHNRGRKAADERFAEAFAMSFLMPASSIRRRFNDVVTATEDFQIADLCRLSHMYFVSVEAMAFRLEGLGLIPRGTRDHLKESGFQVRKASQMLNLPSNPERKDRFPQRYVFLAISAFEQARISEGQLARFLRCDPVTVRAIVAEILTSQEVSIDGEVEFRQPVDFQRSLLTDVF
ncbi:MAG TPA: XRE family transcriptional regulator [Thermoguttaceae bacterium]|nr:XRE family transcriptional regulator [Thermoguttaceae bacterium]